MTRVQRRRTPDGDRVEISQVLAVAPERAWELLADTMRWPDWSPVVREVESTDRCVREGTTGRIRVPGVWLPFTVTSRTDRRWTWRVPCVPSAGHRVDDLGDRRCRVVFEVPFHAAGSVPICLEALENIESALAEDRTAAGEPEADQ
ncbi:SRPBCC family protein [Natrialba swarupiae]|uniref:SRPBCC family protein n=1 Tax=Natrialba swarupiae TaxID=2448032 RepID=A0A5D5AMS1_9EURY|nr:SRPBCC family protein [Natrialba swarupiae]TYT62187.1 SRPBCC family protein [Natrialba swarupiae]